MHPEVGPILQGQPAGTLNGAGAQGDRAKICQYGLQLLQDLEVVADQIPSEVPLATLEHPLRSCTVDLRHRRRV